MAQLFKEKTSNFYFFVPEIYKNICLHVFNKLGVLKYLAKFTKNPTFSKASFIKIEDWRPAT